MADDEFSIFRNLPKRRRAADDNRMAVRNALGMRNFVPEGPLPPRPHASGKGGPSTNQTPPVVTTSVWSAADAAANGMTLTNGGLTVTPSGAAWGTARTSTSKSSGKLYVEFVNITAVGGSNQMFGLASSGFVVTSYLGTSNYSGGAALNGGGNFVSSGFISNNSVVAGLPEVGDVYALAIDFATGNVWLAKNNAWLAGLGKPAEGRDPASGLSSFMSFAPATVGALFAAVSFNDHGAWTLQATAASQTYAPPAGFSAWG